MRLALAVLVGLLPTAAPAEDCVVLLHGLAGSDRQLTIIEETLDAVGYRVVNRAYPSMDMPIDALIGHVDDSFHACAGADRVHFVTYSMGGILLRAWLDEHGPEDAIGRVVMLAPPNHGSEIVDRFGDLALFARIVGPAAAELGTAPDDTPARLGPVDLELGVIAGSLSLNPVTRPFIDGPNDGQVTIESTMIDGMDDHIVLNSTHTFMMNNPVAVAQVMTFLRDGKFDHELTLPELIRRVIGG